MGKLEIMGQVERIWTENGKIGNFLDTRRTLTLQGGNQKIWTENEEKEAKMGKLENLDGK